jgi:integrase/recombinase XerD
MKANTSQPEVMKDLQGFFRAGQIQDIYNSCGNDRDRLLIRLLWKSGRRINEILPLKVEDFDFQEKRILWSIEKKKKPVRKWKPIDKKTTEEARKYICDNDLILFPDKYVFESTYREGVPLSRQWGFQLVRKLCLACDIHFVGAKKPHPHHFRHTFAVEMARKLKNPQDVRKLQMFMEHSSMSTTEQYLQFNDSDLRTLIEED